VSIATPPPLDQRTVELLSSLAQATDGLTDPGPYGATWREDGRPDVLVTFEHLDAGLVELYPSSPAGSQFMLSSLTAATYRDWCARTSDDCSGHPEQRERDLGVPDAQGRAQINTAVWPTVVADAARAGVLLVAYATRDDVPRNEPSIERVEIGGRTVGIVGDDPDQVADVADILRDGPADGTLAAAIDTIATNARVHEAFKAALGDCVGEGYYGAVPTDGTSPDRAADVHVLITPTQGLVRLHPHDEAGDRWIREALLDEGRENETPPFGVLEAPTDGEMGGYTALVSLLNWPTVIGFARVRGILIYSGLDHHR
jgi:hypothetical protein